MGLPLGAFCLCSHRNRRWLVCIRKSSENEADCIANQVPADITVTRCDARIVARETDGFVFDPFGHGQ